MKYFAFADCHGNYGALRNDLANAGYEASNPEHQLIGLGDYFGRAAVSLTDCVNIWKYLKSNEHANKPMCLRGNHEDILIKAIGRRSLTDIDIYNGEHNTFASFAGRYPNQIKRDWNAQISATETMIKCGFLDWLQNLPYYYETEHQIFVHGFVPTKCWQGLRLPLDSPQLSSFVWAESAWSQTPNVIEYFMHENPNGINKWIVFGHWRASELNERFNGKEYEVPTPFIDEKHKLVGLDLTTVITDTVGIAVFNS